jgi:vitamin B12 transporter
MHKIKFLLALFALLRFSNSGFAQNSIIQKTDSIGIYKLSDVVVSATRTEMSTLPLANSISVIDSAEISNSNKISLSDLLKNEPGLSYTQQGGQGTLTNLYIRGGNSSHTLVLIDGVEVNLPSDPGNVYDFSTLPIDNIQRIEVLRGPQSTLYGSDALAGVINIITKKGNGSPKLSLYTEGGSFNTFKILAGFNGSFEKLNYSLTSSRTKSDGFSAASENLGNTEKDGYTFNNFSSLIGYNLGNNTELNFYTRYTNSKSDYDQFGGQFGDDPTYIFDQEEFSIRGESKINLMDKKWNQKLGITFFTNIRKYSFDSTLFNPATSRSNYDGRKYKFDWQNNFSFIDNNLISVGFETEFEEVVSEYLFFSSFGNFESIFPKNDASTFGVFLQDQVKFSEDFFAAAGVRIDNHNKFGSVFTYRIAPAYIYWETGTKFKATMGTGFKAPSLFYLYDPAFGNSELNPEKSFGWDAGIEQFFWKEGFSFGATYFYNKFTNMFGFDNITFRTININKAETNGVEFFAKVRPSEDFDLKLNYTYTNAKDKSENTENFDEKLLRRPEHKAGFLASYSFLQKTNINVELIWVGKRDDYDFSEFKRTQLDSYLLANLAAHYNILDFLRLNFRVDNLFDTDYEDVLGYTTPGISFYGGIKLSLD